MSDNYPSRRDVIAGLAAAPLLESALAAQADSVCFMSAIEIARLHPCEETFSARRPGGALEAD
jgi:hypothetical protein